MDELTHRIVRRVRKDGSSMSRNRNFFTFTDPKARRALRIARHLRDLECDVLEHSAVSEAEDGTVVIRVRYPELNATRTAYLSRREFDLLLEDPRVSMVLGA